MKRPWMSAGRVVGAVLLTLTLSACAGSPALYQQAYSVVPVAAYATPTSRPETQVLPVLQVAEVEAPAWLDSSHYLYRLDYRDPEALRYYGDARWAAAPAQMLRAAAVTSLEQSGDWQAVLTRGEAKKRFRLELRLQNFMLNFSGPDSGQAELAYTATLVDTQSFSVVAQREFLQRVPLRQIGPQGGAAAMAEATAASMAQLRSWAAAAARQSLAQVR
ncbi:MULTISPECIES: ABC-type transport auxiliary lipoprotein family protein [Acidithiobacillus]|jgi:cholesterol transport system auxiliary component|uniref:ABC-type transport auxiliary lipoprotein family protein n=1 Tax=Acidithiobacillus TaxID=119977 RepID=UPI00030F02F1|nr:MULTISPECIES: ABC-type transport auxiliary lipoprotein family protein [Acidithiobacillus]MCY0871916.1 ABC-type transport auxiliary lipoprotein family protein [Acidithiobacillus caldus]